MSNPPATLPANFFESPAPAPAQAAGPPQTLPANFFEQPNQPAAQPAQQVPGAPNGLPQVPQPSNPITQNEELEAGQHRGKVGTVPGLHSEAAATGTLGEYSEAASQPMLGVAGEGVAEGVSKVLPSAARAGKTMNSLREAIGEHPVEMTDNLSKALSRYQELVDNGNTPSTAVKKFINRVTDPEKGHLTYNEARDYLTKFGSMTQEEGARLTGTVKRQIEQIAGNLKQAISETAERGGKLEEFQKSNSEYRNSQILKKVVDWAKDFSIKGVAQKGVAGGAIKELHDLLSSK